MIHAVCTCGALVSAPPSEGARSVPCRACGAAVDFPPGALVAPAPDAAAAGNVPAPAPAAGPAPGGPAAAHGPIPVFDADVRLDLRALEREAARLRFLGGLVVAAGIVAAALALAIPGWTHAERGLLASGALLAATAGWCGLRAARAACLAAVALAQRQREILQRMSR